MLNINDIKRIYLGVQGENLARSITIDVRPWLVEYPGGSVTIWHKRNGDSVPSATGAVFDPEEGTITWTPTNTDTYVSGEGEAEIRLTIGTVIKKSRAVVTGVSPSVTLAGEPLGSDWQSYIDAVDQLRSAAVAAKEAAEAAAGATIDAVEDAEAWAVGQRDGVDVDSSDPTYENNAKYYSEQASGDATDAGNAKTAAETAQGKAEAAQTAAESARDQILGMRATATGLSAGSNPTVTYSQGVMAFGIPKGDTGATGETGATPAISIGTVETLQPNESAYVQLDESSTPEAPVLNFGITKGATGNTGATGTTPDISIGTVATLQPDQSAYVELDASSTPEAPILNFGLPKGEAGSVGTIYGSTIDMSSSDSTKIATAIGTKTDKVQSATSGNFAGLDGNGNLTDSGSKASDFLTSHQDISGKADKVTSATSGNFAGLDGNGNLTDSGSKASDFLTAHQDISGKADKVTSATSGDFAGLDGNGNLTDSGKKASDFMTSSEGGAVEDTIAIVVNGDNAPQNLSVGQYIFLKNHSTLPSGGRHVTASISSGSAITSNNTAADAEGIANALNSKIENPNSFTMESDNSSVSIIDQNCYKLGRLVVGSLRFSASADIPSGQALVKGLPKGKTTLLDASSFSSCATNNASTVAVIFNNAYNNASIGSASLFQSGVHIIGFSYIAS